MWNKQAEKWKGELQSKIKQIKKLHQEIYMYVPYVFFIRNLRSEFVQIRLYFDIGGYKYISKTTRIKLEYPVVQCCNSVFMQIYIQNDKWYIVIWFDYTIGSIYM